NKAAWQDVVALEKKRSSLEASLERDMQVGREYDSLDLERSHSYIQKFIDKGIAAEARRGELDQIKNQIQEIVDEQLSQVQPYDQFSRAERWKINLKRW